MKLKLFEVETMNSVYRVSFDEEEKTFSVKKVATLRGGKESPVPLGEEFTGTKIELSAKFPNGLILWDENKGKWILKTSPVFGIRKI
jgi:hypothetical protein